MQYLQELMAIMINVLERITELRQRKHWTEYQLAEHSGLTQSTISSWYRKGILPTIPSLEKICNAFGISMSQFFYEDDSDISYVNSKQKQLLEHVSKFDYAQLDALNNFLKQL